MSLITITRQPDELQGYQLTSPESMIAALAYIAQGGYSGNINRATSGGVTTWTMWLQSPIQNTSQSAKIGDWIVIRNNSIASVIPEANFAALYNTTP